ncbi:hypothetical protein ABPG75_005056 [Micractinium tetrahymenae]
MSAAQQLLQSARPLVVPQTRQCAHQQARPAPLRRLPSCDADPVVELLVASCAEQGGAPCCILPATRSFRGPQARGLFHLLRLDSLNESTLANALAAVDGHVAQTCAGCPQGRSERGPSPLVYCPEFAAFLERALELARMRPDLGIAPPVLLLQIVSRLNYAADESLAASFRQFYLHLQVTLEAAAELHSEAVTPQVALALFEAWARMGAPPMSSRPFGLALREHTKMGRFAPQELARLLAAMAAVRLAQPRYRPCSYDVADVCSGLLAAGLQELPAPHLASVATSLGAFPWPVYQCVLPLLEAAAQEGVRRQAVGELSPPSGGVLVAAALASARSLNPRLGTELEAKVAGWQAQARVASGNILAFPDGHPAAEAANTPISAFL